MIKMIVESKPLLLLKIFNHYRAQRIFPKIWKNERLVLLKKGNKTANEPSSYRLFWVNFVGKLNEKVIDNRLWSQLEINGENGLGNLKYGFKKGWSTTDPLKFVCQIVETYSKSYKVGMYTLDVNSAPWTKILEEPSGKKIPVNQYQVVDSYLNDREIMFWDAEKTEVTDYVSSGVPRGSVLGPTLWNARNDGLFRIHMLFKTSLVAFADDVTIISVVADTIELKSKLETAANSAMQWLSGVGLNLEINKIEVIVYTNKRRRNKLTIIVDGTEVVSQQHLKYLGIDLDPKLKILHTQDFFFLKFELDWGVVLTVVISPSQLHLLLNKQFSGLQYNHDNGMEGL